MCIIGKPALVRPENASAVSTYLTVVDDSCRMKTSGREHLWLGGVSHTDIGAAMYWEVHSSGVHTASQAFVQDCTVVYGDRRGIASAMTMLDAGAVHGL